MMSVLSYVRNILGWTDDDPVIKTSFKRDREHIMYKIPLKLASSFWKGDDFSDEELSPASKRLKQLRKSTFPDIMADNDTWYKQERPARNVRFVPIEVEAGHPSTSTPIDISERLGRVRTVPINVSERLDRVRTVPINLSERLDQVRTVPTKAFSENGPSTPARKPRMHTPVQPVIHAVIDDEDEDDPDVCWVERKTEKPKKASKVYINLDDDENDAEHDDDEVIFVKKVKSQPQVKPYKYFLTRNDSRDQYYRFSPRSSERSSSPRKFNKFKEPSGIIKSYKRQPSCLPRWLQTQKPANLSQTKSGYLSHNGNARSTLTELYNLNEKKNYQELINKFSATTRPLNVLKPLEVMNIAKDSASFRMTRLSQKQALNEIHFAEKSITADRENESKEYDPITVASINSSDSEIEIVPSESSTSSVRIDPVNSLKESYKGKPVTSEEWLANLNSKYRRKRQETQEKLKDLRRESDIISKVNYEQKLAHLEHKLKHELSIPESLIEEPQPTVELPTLTPEQEKLVNRALGPGPPGQLLVEKFNLRIHRRDLQTLAGLNWLNDEVINFYMNLLMQRSGERPDLPKVYAANTFFYPKLMQSGQAGLRRWTRKVDIFAHDLMVVPVHLGVHWCLSLVDFRERRVQYLDSMGGRNQPCLDALLQYLRDEHQDKKSRPFDDSGWKAECISKEIPQQMNGSDCGMFACTFAEFAARGAPYTFTQAHMPALRRKAALEILLGKLLL